jgi:hypothetical protein
VKAKNSSSSARIYEHNYCKDCGWPVVMACCNNEFTNFKDANEWDWWYYCSNKGCKNHDGKGVFLAPPDWIGGVYNGTE